MRFWFSLFAFAASFIAANEQSIPDKVDFNRDVRPILSTTCFACHGPDAGARKAKLRLDTREGAMADLDGDHAIVPGSVGKSELIWRISSEDLEQRMPPGKNEHKLSDYQIKTLTRWIEQGADYAEHWAFVKPLRHPLPNVDKTDWPKNFIDTFILARLEKERLAPSPEADKNTLIRRLSLDLTGLPPTPEEVDAFIADSSPKAYEKVVDRLLNSPAYGERWARVWLDLARYADSAGYGSDPLRLNIWPYRDWLIGAFNRNLPYDQFTIEQLAGDLLPNPTQDQLLATAFHRNTMTNTEGGTDREEFRVAAVKDRIATTAEVWMGLTMGCAQCHSHKFDPITQKEYYQFFAIFNQTEDADRADDFPTMPLPTLTDTQKSAKLKTEIAAFEKKLNAANPQFDGDFAAWEKTAMAETHWTPLEPTKVHSTSLEKFTVGADHSITAGNINAVSDMYVVTAKPALKNITALRLEALPDDALPAKGPGRAGGNFVLNDISLIVAPVAAASIKGRIVRVELPGKAKFLSLAEVQVFSAGQNVALKGKASQSSVDYDGPPQLAIDGNTNGDFALKSTTHTKQEDNPWWEVDLGAPLDLEKVAVWNRSDGGTSERLNHFVIKVLDEKREAVWQTTIDESPTFVIARELNGQRKLKLKNASADFSQSGFEVEKALGKHAKDSGWAIAPELGKAHQAVFEIDTPFSLEKDAELQVLLNHDFGANHTLGKFRVSVTDQKPPVKVLPANITALLSIAAEKRTAAQQQELADFYRGFAPALKKTRDEIAKLKTQLAAIKPPGVPVMRELPPARQRVSHIFNKGNFLTPGEKVEAGLPEAFNTLPKGEKLDRLAVAKWLVAPENPLTARVAVNRFWAQIFGTGIVETEEDFGTQGALPTHPELLDWLAIEFSSPRDGKAAWDIKALLKTIVTSATYRQSSRVTPELLEKDPHDRLLSRGIRKRLDAEMVRDQALALSGLLSPKIGGPSVYPPQPDGLWRAAFNGERTWATSTGEDKYRRGMYTFWRRTVPYPSMNTFDAPSREQCTLRRFCTNTPLQAFVTLNDPVYVEAAQALARRIVKEGGITTGARAKFGLRLTLARPPSDEQAADLSALFEKELKRYQTDLPSAKKMATEPLGPIPQGMNEPELAAWTVVANVLLNLDGVLTKN